jgi:hypothetical protein
VANVGLPYEDFSSETYKRRVARWRAEVLYGRPPVDHLDPIPQYPPKHTPPPFSKRPKAKVPKKAKAATPTPPPGFL